MKQKFLFVILLFFCVKMQAQPNFKKGYVLNQSGDTIKGFVQDEINSSNLKFCFFKTDINGEITNYSPSQITSFQFEGGEKYISMNYLNKKEENEQVFARVLEEGRVKLYIYEKIYFVQKHNDKILKLDNNEIAVTKDGIEYRRKTKKYLGILSYLMSDYPQIRMHIQKLNFTGKDISRFINKYNSYFNSSKQSLKAKIPWSINEFGGYLSTSFFRPEFSIDQVSSPNHLIDANWRFSQQVGCGFFFENRYTRVSKNTAIHFGAHLQRISYSSDCEVLRGSSTYFYDNQIKHYALNLPLGIKYYQAFGNINAYIMGGVFYRKTFANENKTSILIQRGNSIFIQPKINTYESESAQIGPWFSLGLRKKINEKLDLFSEIRCYQNESKVISKVDNSDFKVKRKIINIGLLIGLYF